ncbi:MAG: ribonuclease HI [Schleiferiaceae bacterium]|nr:MAG: Ribonuclease HI [Cryomorphaceae bacterium]
MRVTIYTDGAASGNPGPGGYGVVLESSAGHRKELSGGFRRTTNNRMELLAVIKGLRELKSTEVQVVVVSDSKYVVDAVNKGWLENWIKKGFKDKKNPDLWRDMIPLLRKYKPIFQWVKGHNNHPQNERCDALAVIESKKKNLPPDVGYESSL